MSSLRQKVLSCYGKVNRASMVRMLKVPLWKINHILKVNRKEMLEQDLGDGRKFR